MSEELTVEDLFRLIGVKEAEIFRLTRLLATRDSRIAELEKEKSDPESEQAE